MGFSPQIDPSFNLRRRAYAHFGRENASVGHTSRHKLSCDTKKIMIPCPSFKILVRKVGVFQLKGSLYPLNFSISFVQKCEYFLGESTITL